ncbi:MAG: hypothetical protein EHM12_10910 [Dehalococcoidia bacterium]|nr:MAG: hypothetical protein EHM12_10910 [Dehalococcoidia bacterium]
MSRTTGVAIWVGFYFVVVVLMEIANIVMSASRLGSFASRFDWFRKPLVLVAGIIILLVIELIFTFLEKKLSSSY